MIWIKVCGITRCGDALAAAEAGADAVGFVFAESPRRIDPAEAAAVARDLPPGMGKAGVFVDADRESILRIAERVGLDFIQLHGGEKPAACLEYSAKVIKAFRVTEAGPPSMEGYEVWASLLDAPRAGGGRPFDWSLVEGLRVPGGRLILAGGLSPENVAEAVRRVRPFGVDASSALESSPGRKDAGRIRLFLKEARRAEREREENEKGS